MTRRTNHAEKRLNFTASSASYDWARPSDEKLSSTLKKTAEQQVVLSKKPKLLLTFERISEKAIVFACDIELLRIKIEPDRKRSRSFFASVCSDHIFLFGASGWREPERALERLFESNQWLFLHATWLNLRNCYAEIIVEGIESTSKPAKNAITSFSRKHLHPDALWHWESPAMERKRRKTSP